ncbi:MAG: serine/threonine-protein kinase, partial [Verrucomicrobiota bacterium]
MSGPNLCPMCQSALPPSAPEGLCPKCLWASLLTADANAEQELLESPLVPFPHGKRPDILGDYELLSEIARGGMGVVYRARQISLQRVVALKMISTPRLPGEAEMQRFRAEAEAVARLEHPNIVPIYEVGEEDGRAYFTMKFVAGGSLADQLAQLRSSTNPPDAEQSYTSAKEISGFPSESAATLIAKIARAVHHAHRYGILHRDLKPSNILLDERGEPLVTDFGLAKQLETESHLTLSGAVLGTPAYIAPEQAVGGKSLTTAADVYSLGGILYELLTGRPPFQADTPLATLRQVVDLDPVRPSAINPDLDRQLEAICLSCLHKNPTQRYSSAEALADDLDRWLRHEPILAQPSTWTDRIGKWSRRHPARAALITLGILAPAIIIGVLWDAERKLRRERNNAVDQEAKARVSARHAETAAGQANLLRAQTRQSLYAADMLLAQHALDEGNLNLARRLVASYRPSIVNHAGATNAPDLRGFEWRVLWERCQGEKHETLLGHFNPVYSVAFSPDSQWLASGDAQGKVKLWEMASRRPFATLELSNKAVVQITFSADGKSLSASDESGRAVVWNLASREIVWQHQGRNPLGVQFSPVTHWIGVTSGDLGLATNSYARVIDWTTGQEVFRVGPQADFEAFSPDGKLALITRRKEIGTEIWELTTGKVLKTIPGSNASLAVSPDGKMFAASWPARGVFLAHITGSQESVWLNSPAPLGSVLAFSSDGSMLAGASSDQRVRLWNVSELREMGHLLGHVDSVTSVAFSPDGQWLASSGMDHSVLLWPTAAKRAATVISNTWPPYVISPDGSKLAGMVGTDVTRRT